jgi:hypothetical protein
MTSPSLGTRILVPALVSLVREVTATYPLRMIRHVDEELGRS